MKIKTKLLLIETIKFLLHFILGLWFRNKSIIYKNYLEHTFYFTDFAILNIENCIIISAELVQIHTENNFLLVPSRHICVAQLLVAAYNKSRNVAYAYKHIYFWKTVSKRKSRFYCPRCDTRQESRLKLLRYRPLERSAIKFHFFFISIELAPRELPLGKVSRKRRTVIIMPHSATLGSRHCDIEVPKEPI